MELSYKKTLTTLVKLADCYNQLGTPEKTLSLLKSITKRKNCNAKIRALYADNLKGTGKYKQAIDEYNKAMTTSPQLDYTNKIEGCKNAIKWLKTSNHYTVENIKNINTPYSEMGPAFFENNIVFSSNKENMLIKRKDNSNNAPLYSFYVIKNPFDIENCKMESFSTFLNSKHHEGGISFSKNFDTVYYARSFIDFKTDSGQNRIKIFSAQRKKSSWTNPKKFIFNHSKYSQGQPAISPDGKMLFFASDMPGGFGGVDIWVCVKVDSNWTDPINLGENINSENDEIFPYYNQKGELYFSSNRDTGMGGFDIYLAGQKEGYWLKAENLKSPINSPFNEYSFIFNHDNNFGYLTSNRPTGKGKEDIYFVKKINK